jgi:hypothetical protein
MSTAFLAWAGRRVHRQEVDCPGTYCEQAVIVRYRVAQRDDPENKEYRGDVEFVDIDTRCACLDSAHEQGRENAYTEKLVERIYDSPAWEDDGQ